MTARQRALEILALVDPIDKAAQTRALVAGLDPASIDPETVLATSEPVPGRPTLPRLVSPNSVPRRSPATPEGRAALL
ncbi:MAG: DUF455 domain-containing protein, partial [Burkholderiaceae bacterium]